MNMVIVMMMYTAFCVEKLQNLFNGACLSVSCLRKKFQPLWSVVCFLINPALFLQIFYFLLLSSFGYGILKILKPRSDDFEPRNLDLFFTSVSATTVSSMSTVEMEVFSNGQLVAMTFLMLVGGEVFTSMLGLQFNRSEILKTWKNERRVTSVESNSSHPQIDESFEWSITVPRPDLVPCSDLSSNFKPFIKYDSIRFLGFIILGYFLVVQIFGVVFVQIYFVVISSAKEVLSKKGLNPFTFAVYTVVSTFASCGFVPTNENMMVFSKNSGLLLILIPQVLLGNTLLPLGLRFSVWIMGKKFKKEEAKYLLKHTLETGYKHLLPGSHSLLLMATVFGFILIGFVLLCALEWNSAAFDGLSFYEKVVGAVFQSVNARHTGETILDLSTIAPAILVFFVAMMYLPPYTSFLPVNRSGESPLEYCEPRRIRVGENLILSQLSYLTIFIVLICITERKSLKHDPLNFSVLNIAFEVISAYGNVGFSMGYACSRQLVQNPSCVDKLYGFSGKWSDEGKIILIVVMVFGRLKKFNMNGGRAWKLM